VPRLGGLIETESLFEAGFEANTDGSLFVTSFGACLFNSLLCSAWPVALLVPDFADMMLVLDCRRDVADVSKLHLEISRLRGTLTEPSYFRDARLASRENGLDSGWQLNHWKPGHQQISVLGSNTGPYLGGIHVPVKFHAHCILTKERVDNGSAVCFDGG